jgi:hypothetical protein
MAEATIIVVVTMPLTQAIGVVTALGQYDLDDDDVGGADDLREFYVELRDSLNMPEPEGFEVEEGGERASADD